MFNAEEKIILDKFLNNFLYKSDAEINFEEISYYFSALYENQLEPIGENFSTFENYDFNTIFDRATKNGFPYSKLELYSSLIVIKEFYFYALNFNKKYEKPYNELSNCLENFFYLNGNLSSSIENFYFEDEILDLISYDIQIPFLDIYSAFLEIFTIHTIKVSKNSNMLTPSSIRLISEELKLTPSKNVKLKKQHHYPLIDLFFNFSLDKKLVEIDNNYFTVDLTDRISLFFSFDISEQYGIFLHYISGNHFINKFFKNKNIDQLNLIVKDFIQTFLFENKLNLKITKYKGEFFYIFDIFSKLNLIIIEGEFISITDLGLEILNYYFKYYKNFNILNFKKTEK